MAANTHGFTLLELLIALLVLAVTLSLAAPGLQRTLHDNRLEVEARRLLEALQLARSEAVMRNRPVSLCPSSLARGGAASCDGTYADGWIVFVNPDRNREVAAAGEDILRVYGALPGGYLATNRSGSRSADELVNYLPDGSAHRNLTLQLCPPPGSSAPALSIVLNIVGRARLARDWGECPGAA